MASVSPTSNDGSLSRYYTKVLNEAEKEKQAEIKRMKERSERELQETQNSYQRSLEKNMRDAEKSLQNVRDDSQEAISHERQHSQDSLEKLREQIYNQRGQMEADRAFEKRGVDAFIADTERRHELEQQAHNQREADLTQKLENLGLQNDQQLKDFKDTQMKAMDQVNENNKRMQVEIQKDADDRARAAVDRGIQQENFRKKEVEGINSSYQRDMKRLNRNQDSRDNYYSKVVDDVTRDKDRQYTDIIRNTDQSHASELQNLERSFDAYSSQVQKKQQEESARRDEVLNNQIQAMGEEKETALINQAKNYQTSANVQREQDQDTIKELEKSVQKTKTSEDISSVSPAAEENIRKKISKGYEKTLRTARDQQNQIQEEMYGRHREEINEAREGYQSALTRANHEFESLQSRQSKEFFGSMVENEMDTNSKLQEKEAQSDRQAESLHRHYSRLLDRQKRGYEDAFDANRIIAQNKVNDVRQESELALRVAHKDYVSKANLIVKDYEKKLADQKETYENKLDDIRTKNSMELHNSEIKQKLELETQAKGYDQKLAQIQVQAKERERVISQNFQDELDRTKRAYELVLQKKS
jgi:hypothetical protein